MNKRIGQSGCLGISFRGGKVGAFGDKISRIIIYKEKHISMVVSRMAEDILEQWKKMSPKEKAAAVYVGAELAEIVMQNRPHLIDTWLSERFPLLGERMKLAQERRKNIIARVKDVSKNLYETL